MLETMRGVGHSWEADNFLTLGASVRGSKVYSESGGMSHGRSTSTNSPGQTVIDVGVERSTIARRAVEFTVAETVAKNHLALSCNVVSFHKGGACQYIHVKVLDDNAFEGEISAFAVLMRSASR